MDNVVSSGEGRKDRTMVPNEVTERKKVSEKFQGSSAACTVQHQSMLLDLFALQNVFLRQTENKDPLRFKCSLHKETRI